MIHYIILINRESGILMLEKRLSDVLPDIKSDLLSGMLVALRKFSMELQIGELSTFNTHNKKFLISVTKNTLVALIIDLEDSEQEYEKLALNIGKIFQESYDVENWDGNIEFFEPFNKVLDSLLKEFEWKQAGPNKLLTDPLVEGFILYNKVNKIYYNFTMKGFDVIKLIRNAEARNENKIRVDQENKIYYNIKNESAGCIIIFDSRVPPEKVNRYSKTCSFLIENLNYSYNFQKDLLKSAKKIFQREMIDLIIQNNNKSLLQIFLTAKESLNIIEDIRKFKIRDLITIKSN